MNSNATKPQQPPADRSDQMGSVNAKLVRLDTRIARNKEELERNSAELSRKIAELFKQLKK